MFISVGADVSAAVSGLTSLENRLNSTANQFRAAAPAALLLEGAAVAVGAGFLSSVKVAADFESQMAGVRAVLSPAEVQQFGGALDALALTLGRDTTFTSRQAAAAIEELIKAGLPAQAVLDGAAAGALNLAAATGVSTADAATIAAQALNTFGISAAESTAVVDKFAGVANTSASDISFLRFGLASVGGVAAGLGLSFNDTADALGLLSKTFAGGSDAGTSFKTFLERLQPQTKAQREEFAKLGIITAAGGNAFFDAAGHVQSLANIAGVLQRSLGGMTDQQRQAALQTLFGTDAIRAALGLYAAGADGVKAFAEASGQQGIAALSAKTRLDSLEGALNNLGGSFETVQIAIGKLFLPTLRDAANFARTLVDGFGALSPETQRLAVFVTGGAAAFVGLIAGMVLLGAIIPPLVVSFGALNAILFANPIGLIVLAITGLVTAFVVAFNTSEDFRNSALGLWDIIQNKVWPALVATAGAIRDQLAPFFDQASQLFGAFVADVGPKVVEFFQTTLPAALAAMGTQIATLGPLFNALTGFFGAVFNVISALASIGGTALQGLFENVLVPGFQALGQALEPIRPVLEGAGAALQSMGAGLGLIGDLVKPVTDFFLGITKPILDFAEAIRGIQLPEWLVPRGAAPGTPGAAAGGATFQQTGFNFGAGGGGGNVFIGNITVQNEADEDRLVGKIASVISGSARRVNPPPDNSGFPTLQPSGII